MGRVTRGIIVKLLDCGHRVTEFELQYRYYVHVRTNTFGKFIELPYFPSLVWFRLICWVLWHINLYRLFNAKAIFM